VKLSARIKGSGAGFLKFRGGTAKKRKMRKREQEQHKRGKEKSFPYQVFSTLRRKGKGTKTQAADLFRCREKRVRGKRL